MNETLGHICEDSHKCDGCTDETQSLFVIDRNGNILVSNTFTALTLGLPLEQLLKSNVADLVKKGLYNHSFALDTIREKKIVRGVIKTHTGLSIDSISTPLFDADGEVNLVVSTSSSNQNWDFENSLNVKEKKKERNLVKTISVQKSPTEQKFIVAESTAMKQILKACDQIASSDCKVLLIGESGTGKEVLSKYIHNKSNRASQAFISVNCAAIPETLFESELFGHEKGAFTGASSMKKGLLELADSGTLFLDEVSEMPLDLQAKLLRVLEYPEIRRIGGTTSFKVDFRLIAATNRNLEQMVEEGKFRKDLYYRINVVPIHIPPLRTRHQDIIGLSSKFIFEYNQKYKKNTKLNPLHFKYLLQHSWPGNIRELKNYIERLVVIDEGFDVNENLKIHDDQILIDFNSLDGSHKENWPTLKEFLKEAEEKYILKVLSECNGKKGMAAEILGIYRTVLYRKLKELNE